MNLLNDACLFAAVIAQGGFSRAAKHLGLSNGLVSRRITHLETKLGVTLIKRTTRQLHLTPEGELFWQYAQSIQQDLETAINLVHASAKKAQGTIRISAPLYFGRTFLAPIIIRFLKKFNDMNVHLDLSNQRLDPVKENLDLIIRGSGYTDNEIMKNSNLRQKLLFRNNIGLYASATYLKKNGAPKSVNDLAKHIISSFNNTDKFSSEEQWPYTYKKKNGEITVKPQFISNDIETSLTACISGYCIGKFNETIVKKAVQAQQLYPILQNFQWGKHNLYIVYANQRNLPQRTRLFLEFIYTELKNL